MKKTPFSVALAFFALVAMAAAPAMMTVTFDPSTGTGFAGKGDVQLALGYNNKQLQENAGSLVFTASSVSETTWECSNSNNENIQERSRTTTTQGVVSGVARERNQITGFYLNGYSGSVTEATDGPALNSCPSGPWSYVEGSTATVGGEGSSLFVNGVQLQ